MAICITNKGTGNILYKYYMNHNLMHQVLRLLKCVSHVVFFFNIQTVHRITRVANLESRQNGVAKYMDSVIRILYIQIFHIFICI